MFAFATCSCFSAEREGQRFEKQQPLYADAGAGRSSISEAGTGADWKESKEYEETKVPDKEAVEYAEQGYDPAARIERRLDTSNQSGSYSGSIRHTE